MKLQDIKKKLVMLFAPIAKIIYGDKHKLYYCRFVTPHKMAYVDKEKAYYYFTAQRTAILVLTLVTLLITSFIDRTAIELVLTLLALRIAYKSAFMHIKSVYQKQRKSTVPALTNYALEFINTINGENKDTFSALDRGRKYINNNILNFCVDELLQNIHEIPYDIHPEQYDEQLLDHLESFATELREKDKFSTAENDFVDFVYNHYSLGTNRDDEELLMSALKKEQKNKIMEKIETKSTKLGMIAVIPFILLPVGTIYIFLYLFSNIGGIANG